MNTQELFASDNPLKVAIADDHQLIIDGLSLLLSNKKNIQIVGLANNGKALLRVISNNIPDLILLDIEMPEMDGIKTAKLLKEMHPSIKIIILSMHDSAKFVQPLYEIGVDGYLRKNVQFDELSFAIDMVEKGRQYFPKEILEKILAPKVGTQKQNSLTPKELTIVCMICKGKKTKEIAEELNRSESAIERHRSNIFNKLGIKNAPDLVRYAMENELCH